MTAHLRRRNAPRFSIPVAVLPSRFFLRTRARYARALPVVICTVAALLWLSGVLPTVWAESPHGVSRRDRAGNKVARRIHAGDPSPTQSPTPAATPSPTPTPAAAPDDLEQAGQKVKLYYLREATKITAVLNAIASKQGSELSGLVVTNATDDEIIIYGPKEKRNKARRIIAALDLPRPGIDMEMWGIQISSRKPEKMADVMPEVRRTIDQTQQAMRETYLQLQRLTREAIPDGELDPDFRRVLVDDLYYRSALDANRPLSLADILLRMIAAKKPGEAAATIANRLDAWLRNSPHRHYVLALDRTAGRNTSTGWGSDNRLPFERFFGARGLRRAGGQWSDVGGEVKENAEQGRGALLDFALHYGRLIHQPQSFSAYSLQQSAEVLNTRLQAATDALNLDTQDLFVAPTLDRIREIVRGFKDVEYAQAGKVSVASLSGVATVVTSHSVNAFDVTPPLRLSELLDKADKLSKSAGTFVPKPADNLVGAMPLSQVIGLIGAFGEERSVWRELQSGVSITVTPNVLRNMTSAELQIGLKTGDPQAGSREQGVRPLSRVSQHDVSTSVYVNALDFFDLSAFASQSTLDGGRGYVPIVGPVWRGLFGEIPVAGRLFSWRRSPQTVFSESLVLTTSFITPTAMGVALLYPTELVNERGEVVEYNNNTFKIQWNAVMEYKAGRRAR